jgi:hypothetical protein
MTGRRRCPSVPRALPAHQDRPAGSRGSGEPLFLPSAIRFPPRRRCSRRGSRHARMVAEGHGEPQLCFGDGGLCEVQLLNQRERPAHPEGFIPSSPSPVVAKIGGGKRRGHNGAAAQETRYACAASAKATSHLRWRRWSTADHPFPPPELLSEDSPARRRALPTCRSYDGGGPGGALPCRLRGGGRIRRLQTVGVGARNATRVTYCRQVGGG